MPLSPRAIHALDTGLRLAVREAGAGPTVLALHGLADHAGVWEGLADHLADRHRVVAPDLRGHGESDAPGTDAYAAADLAADLDGLARALALEPAHVVAHSWAAKVALTWAARSPERVRSLVLVDPFFVNRLPGVFRPTLPMLYRMLPFLRAMGPFPDLDAAEAVARGLKQYRGWVPRQQAVFREGMVQAPDGTWRSRFAVAARDGVFDDMLRTDGLTARLDVPTTLLLPEGGLNKTAWQTAVYRRHVPRLEIVSIPGNHWPHLLAPDTFHRAVDEALAGVDAGPASAGPRP